MQLVIAAVGLWFLAMASRKGFWPVLGQWLLTTAAAVAGMTYGGWL